MKILLIVIILILIGCSARFSGDHPVAQLRGMWATCFISVQRTAPGVKEDIGIQHCDCFIDTVREHYKSNDYDSIKNLSQKFSDISKSCFSFKPNELQ